MHAPPLLEQGATDATRAIAVRLMSRLHTAIITLRETRDDSHICLECAEECNGFRRRDKTLCPAWGEKKNRPICFSCGYLHSNCRWRRATTPDNCSMCMLPWSEVLGQVFHYGSVKDDPERLARECKCKLVGDVLQAAVARIWCSPDAKWTEFTAACSRFAEGSLPARRTASGAREPIAAFDAWLNRASLVRNGVRNWEIFILVALGVDLEGL